MGPEHRVVSPAGAARWPRNPLARYARWLHTRWPAGTVERLPRVNPDGTTNVPGLYIVGDLTGIPLLKFSADSGAKAVRHIAAKRAASSGKPLAIAPSQADHVYDLVIIGGGVSGHAAALEARKAGLDFLLIEAAEPFSTIVNFPKAKPIYTYPTDMTPAGDLQFTAQVKEPLVEELIAQTRDIRPLVAQAERIVRRGGMLEVALADGRPSLLAHSVIVAIGRSGNFRKLDVPGEELNKVFNRLHDPKDFADRDVLVVGGGDSALEAAIAIAEVGGRVTLCYRGAEFSRPKPDNIERLEHLRANSVADDHKPGSIRVLLQSRVKEIRERDVIIEPAKGERITIPNDAVFTMIGREAPLDFLRRSGVKVAGDRGIKWWVSLVAFLLFCIWMYHWKKSGVTITGIPGIDARLDIGTWWQNSLGWFPHNVPAALDALGGAWSRPSNVLGVLRTALGQPGFYYSLVYCACVVGFGIDRMRRTPTPYVRWQTTTLVLLQVVPLFLLPYLILPWMGHNGWFAEGSALAPMADQLFERYDAIGHDRAYWRSFGFVLAWPLFIFNVFTDRPMWVWLGISVAQTFVLIPAMIYFWGKGAYCGWVCSCGALAETLGDRHRHKMPHGPAWNRLNMLGQGILAFAMALLALRILGWAGVGWAANVYTYGLSKLPVFNYLWFVDVLWAGILGVGLYFWFSGRVWCRFACPLAALMHIYARFSRFRILADKKRCISCNVCTSVCHQGIDVMNFANKGLPMADPQCVRCSACVQSCPTGVLEFGQVAPRTGKPIRKDPDWLAASPVLMREIGVNGRKVAV